MTEINLDEILNFAIADELLQEAVPGITKEKVQEIWALCKGNPWDAIPLYHILDIVNNDRTKP